MAGSTSRQCSPLAALPLRPRCRLRPRHAQGMTPDDPLAMLPHPTPQKRRPTSFQLFPNAREVVLVPRQRLRTWSGGVVQVVDENEMCAPPEPAVHRMDVPGLFRLPSSPADVAAARAVLAGVTRLDVRCAIIEPAQLSTALLCLRGLRAVSLLQCRSEMEQGAEELGADLVAALAWCPQLESLEWDVWWWYPRGAWVQGRGDGHWDGRERAVFAWSAEGHLFCCLRAAAPKLSRTKGPHLRGGGALHGNEVGRAYPQARSHFGCTSLASSFLPALTQPIALPCPSHPPPKVVGDVCCRRLGAFAPRCLR
jgi:hypothetical protein